MQTNWRMEVQNFVRLKDKNLELESMNLEAFSHKIHKLIIEINISCENKNVIFFRSTFVQ